MDVREKLVELPIEDALLVLREEHRQRTDSYTTYLAHGGKGDPAEEVGLDALAIAISALEKTKWISVEDRLPEHRDVVLCFMRFGEQRILQWDNVSSWWLGYGHGDDWQKADVTNWMPLPERPKGE